MVPPLCLALESNQTIHHPVYYYYLMEQELNHPCMIGRYGIITGLIKHALTNHGEMRNILVISHPGQTIHPLERMMPPWRQQEQQESIQKALQMALVHLLGLMLGYDNI